ncbi:DUF6765 family protein [Vibrio sp. MA40-2]|uniref:DUF6765 family protein n=1 Tax=Vibrio sp. MA40-2 TaxID=3391828 RepID=UPI0039A5ECEB
MQSDMHYYGTYVMARTAGLSMNAAKIIATSAQFVDDNAQTGNIEFGDASSCSVEPTAFHTTSVYNVNSEAQRNVWVPFHFIPGNEGEGFTERLVCRKDSPIAQQMRDHHLTQKEKPYYLELVGIMAHVYADTFAHYGFSGVSSRQNRVDNESFEFEGIRGEIKDYIVSKKSSFFEKFTPLIRNIKSNLAEEVSGALGHGAVVTFPDRPFLKWRFNYQYHGDSGWRDNTNTFLEYCEKIHAAFRQVAMVCPQHRDESQYRSWVNLKESVLAVLRVQGCKQQRMDAWCEATVKRKLFNVSETIPEYQDWNAGFEDLSQKTSDEAMQFPAYRFYQAASYHRWYVLRDLLPMHKLMVI